MTTTINTAKEGMTLKYFMGIDVGTYSTKGVLIDGDCRIKAQFQMSHELSSPKPGYFEHDAEKIWWGEVCMTAQKLLSVSGISPRYICGIGISALGCDVVAVDKDCRPLCPAILYGIDTRASSEIRFLTESYGTERMNQLFHRPLTSSDCMPKILWLKNHCPDIYKKAYKFLTASSFITARLTGQFVIDRFLMNSFAPVYKEDGHIDSALCNEFYCSADQLAVPVPTDRIVGYITKQAACETGLLEGTPVMTGTDDSAAEAVSCGIVTPGEMMVQLGSSCYLIYCTQRKMADSRLFNSEYIVPGTYCIDGGTNGAGALTRWLKNTMFRDLDDKKHQSDGQIYSMLADMAQRIPPGSDGLITLPYFAGERTPLNNPDAKGIIFGLSYHHTREHIYRSALEGTAYTIDANIDVLKDNGFLVPSLTAAGGGAQNKLWLQIIADITGIPVKKPLVTIGASYGDALIAAVGTGHISDFSALAPYIVIENIYYPNQENTAVYKQGKFIFHELYSACSPFMTVYDNLKEEIY